MPPFLVKTSQTYGQWIRVREGDHRSVTMNDGRSGGEYIDRHMGTVKEESMVLLSAAESNIEACCDHKAARGPFSSDRMAQ